VYEVPGHTRGHVIFKVGKCLFSGDFLFLAGVGKFFEGTAADMFPGLYTTIRSFPEETLLFPGHEYAVSNLEFACWIQPENKKCLEKLEWCQERRKSQLTTIPSTLGEERSYNPFLRADDLTVAGTVKKINSKSKKDQGEKEPTSQDILQLLRNFKDQGLHKSTKL